MTEYRLYCSGVYANAVEVRRKSSPESMPSVPFHSATLPEVRPEIVESYRDFEPKSIFGITGKSLRVLLTIAILGSLLTLPAPSIACSIAGCAGDGVEMRHNFLVKVTFGGMPLTGVIVKVTGFGGEGHGTNFFSGTTGSNGIVNIGELAPGLYWLDAEFLGIAAASQCFHIASSATRKAKTRLAFEWGDEAPAVRQISGRLIDSQPGRGSSPISNLIHRVDVPIVHAKMKLQSPATAEVYGTESDSDGHFTFGSIPAGTYVLHIDGGTVANGRDYESTDLLVAVDDKAKSDTLLLARRDAGGGSCGGTYLELRNAPN